MPIDYHVHTPLCNHAKGRMADFVVTAMKRGIKEICFLEHLTLHPAGRHLSLSPMEVGLYFHAVRELSRRFAGRIRVLAGLEIDFCPDYIEQSIDIIERFDFDAIGGSVHFIGDRNIVSTKAAKINPIVFTEKIYQTYLDLLYQMADMFPVDFICHLDVVKKFNDQPPESFYQSLGPILAKCRDRGLAIEVNTSGLRHPAKSVYPDVSIIQMCADMGIPVTLGSDAHSPGEVAWRFEDVLPILRGAGINRLWAATRRVPRQIFIDSHQQPYTKSKGVMSR